MLFPFLFLAVSLAAGILFSSLLSFSAAVGFAGLAVFLIAGWTGYFLKKNRACFVFLLLAAAFLGMGVFSHADGAYEANRLRRFDYNGYADFTGRLTKTAFFDVGRTVLQIKVESVRFLGREEKLVGTLRVTVHHPDRYPSPLKLRAGDRVTVSAQVLPERDFRNFGEPRRVGRRKISGVHNHAVSKSPLLVEIEKRGDGFSLRRLISGFRLRLLGAVEEHFSSPDGSRLSREGAVLEAMLLGERGRMDDETVGRLQKSGLFHLIAISGAHIAIISFLLYSLLRFLRLPRRAIDLSLIVLLIFYAVLVEGRASVFRAAIMTIVYLVGRLFWRKANLLNSVSLSAFILLLLNPFSLFDIGFELTFAATLAIIVFYPRIVRFLPRLPGRIHELFSLSLSAQLGVLPLIARTFHRVAFSSLLLNIPAVPLVGVIMAGGFLFFAAALLSSSLAQFLALGLKLLVRVFVWIAGWLDFLPGFSYRLPAPHPATVIGYFAFLLILAVRPRFLWQRLSALGFLAVFLVLIATYPFPASYSPSLKVTVLDVGQGDSVLVEFPGRKKMLVDGGGTPDRNFDIGESVVSPFLLRKGIKKIDYLVLTHAHPDHMNGLLSVAKNFKLGEFWEAFSPPSGGAYDELKAALSRSVAARRVFEGFVLRESGVDIEVLHPPRTEPLVRPISNEDSLVLRLAAGAASFLLAADIGIETEAEIVGRGRDIRSLLLKSPHHGSRTSSSAEFLAAVRPQAVVVTAGRGNPYGVPHPDVLERYRSLGAEVYRTDEAGAVEVEAAGDALRIRSAAATGRPAGLYNENCGHDKKEESPINRRRPRSRSGF